MYPNDTRPAKNIQNSMIKNYQENGVTEKMMEYILIPIICFVAGIIFGNYLAKELLWHNERVKLFHKEWHYELEIKKLEKELERKEALINNLLDK